MLQHSTTQGDVANAEPAIPADAKPGVTVESPLTKAAEATIVESLNELGLKVAVKTAGVEEAKDLGKAV